MDDKVKLNNIFKNNPKKYNSNYSLYNIKKIISLIYIFLITLVIYLFFKKKNYINNRKEIKIYFDKYEVKIYNELKEKLQKTNCSQMWNNQREFLNGIIRKFRPKKILEIGVALGGSSIIILNAIKDIKNAYLYSIDLNNNIRIGHCVPKFFPEFLNKWSLYKGNIAAKFIESIGGNIDMVLIDSAHFEPGEIIDFLIVLPFLKEGAIVCFHDIGNQITKAGYKNSRKEWAPYLIYNIIRGKKYLPSGNQILTHDIGAIKLENNQYKYIHDYFRVLGGQWQYFPKEMHINLLRKLFNKYYDKDCLIMFEETVSFNRKFVRNNPMKNLYNYNSD
jgi:predicted O-methyltransferase YrrM